MFESIKIFHHWHHNDEYLFWKDFFELVGLYVSDFSSEFDNLSSDYSAILVLKNDISDEKINIFKRRYPNAIILDNYSDFKNLNTYFKEGLKLIKENCYELSDSDYEVLQQIGDIYIKYKISYHINACKSVLETNKYTIYNQARRSLDEAYEEAGEMLQVSSSKNFYLLYTLSNLKYQINNIYSKEIGAKSFIYNEETCLDLIEELAYLFPNYGKSNLLYAKVYNMYKNSANSNRKAECLVLLQMLLESIYLKPYDSAFYDMSKIYSSFDSYTDRARELEQKAFIYNNFSPKYYYNIGLESKKSNENVLFALRRLEKGIYLLKNKYENNYLLPEEQIYFFYMLHVINGIYGDTYMNTIKYEKGRTQLREFVESLEKRESIVAAQEIFGDNAHVFQEGLHDAFRRILRKYNYFDRF